jgi:hypothetical protein
VRWLLNRLKSRIFGNFLDAREGTCNLLQIPFSGTLAPKLRLLLRSNVRVGDDPTGTQRTDDTDLGERIGLIAPTEKIDA